MGCLHILFEVFNKIILGFFGFKWEECYSHILGFILFYIADQVFFDIVAFLGELGTTDNYFFLQA